MKTVILLLSVLLSISGSAQEQRAATSDDVYIRDTISYKDWTPGYIVMASTKDTIYGLLDIKAKGNLLLSGPMSIRVHTDSRKDKRYSANKVSFLEYQDSAGIWQRSEAFPLAGDGSNIFVKQYAGGHCRIFMITRPDILATAMFGLIGALLAEQEVCYFIQKGNSSLWPIQKASFKKDMLEFFQKCPNMVSKLKGGIFTYDKWQTMVTYYNDNGCH